jgi:hypothetical protein
MRSAMGLYDLCSGTVPENRACGTAFGIFNLISGCALLLASVIAGTLWSTFGAPVTFLAGVDFALIAVVGLIAF